MRKRMLMAVIVLVVVAGFGLLAHELNLAQLLLGLNPHAVR